MSPTSHPLLTRILPPFHHRRQPDSTSLYPQQAAESYVPTWQREGTSASGERPTGRRKPSASTGSDPSSASDSASDRQRRLRAKSEPGGGMLYFGEQGGASRQQNTHLCPSTAASWPGPSARPKSSSAAGSSASAAAAAEPRRPRATTGAAARVAAGTGPAFASGRDASGHLRTGVNSTSIMTGTYASLTYGGSVQF